MGVKDLWNILSPSCEKKSLWELEGLTIAIDLSSWIVDSQNVGDNRPSLMNMYLRNLFFRTSYLLLIGVKPIFILEGRAPTLKHDTIARRLQVTEKQQPNNKTGSRGRLNCLQKKCEELLLSLGVRCYKSEGEAEALCSQLNQLGIVDAVISQDSDCFLYGARTVLRNFTMAPAYTCDKYSMEDITCKLDLGRHKLLALSLLCGCDYEAGVQGVGKQTAVKFLATVREDQVLDRLRSWRTDNSLDVQASSSQLTKDQNLELGIKKKALLDPNFPSEEVISEFLTSKAVDVPQFSWSRPSLSKFVVFAERMLAWDEDYSEAKFLPLVSRWHLTHNAAECCLTLQDVVKKRTVRGVASYELRWIETDSLREMTTVEPITLVASAYPHLHQAFLKSKEKPKKAPRGRKKKNVEKKDLEDVENLLENLNIYDNSQPKPLCKKKSKQKPKKGLQTLDRFLKEIPTNICNRIRNESGASISHSTPLKNQNKSRSCHYLSDDSITQSPLHNSVQMKSASLDDLSMASVPIKPTEHSMNLPSFLKSPLHNSVQMKSASLDDLSMASVPIKPIEHSMNLPSFLDSSYDSSAANLSDIVQSIVTRSNCNPAVNIWTSKLSQGKCCDK